MNKRQKLPNYILLLSTLILLAACKDKSSADQPIVDNSISIIKQSSLTLSHIEKVNSDSSAHWLTTELLVLPKAETKLAYQLVNKTNADFQSTELRPVEFPSNLGEKYPHLADFQAYNVGLTRSQAKAWLKQQLIVVGTDADESVKQVAYVQIGAVIDDLFTQGVNDANEETNLGATISEKSVSFKLWAPTAKNVELLLFNDDLSSNEASPLQMKEDSTTGIWSASGDSALNGAYYQYQITVYHPETKKIETLITTDPYSLSLSVNSKHSQVVDLNAPSTQPEHWGNHTVPTISNVEDNIFYETHIRDFSSDDNALSNNAFRGKYKAFSEEQSSGVTHLKSLRKAGLNNIHLLPTYDLASINEDATVSVDINDSITVVKTKVCNSHPELSLCSKDYTQLADFNENQSLKSLLERLDVNGEEIQAIVSELRQLDNFNWGYDPFHYTVPEGSYALNPQGAARLVEFREMVQSLHGLGFRVIMDVVYNHTFQFGLKEKSVLDKVVPSYYHRLNIMTGEVEQTTCYTCGNTATERVMMAKLMTDSLVVWARDYKIDGFRFDLMGHQTKDSMLAAREAVRAVD